MSSSEVSAPRSEHRIRTTAKGARALTAAAEELPRDAHVPLRHAELWHMIRHRFSSERTPAPPTLAPQMVVSDRRADRILSWRDIDSLTLLTFSRLARAVCGLPIRRFFTKSPDGRELCSLIKKGMSVSSALKAPGTSHRWASLHRDLREFSGSGD